MSKILKFSYKLLICFSLVYTQLFSIKAYSETNRISIGNSSITSRQTDSLKLYGINVEDLSNRTRAVLIGKRLKARWFILKRGNRLVIDIAGIKRFYNNRNGRRVLDMKNARYISYAFHKKNGRRYLRVVLAFNKTIRYVHFINRQHKTEFDVDFKLNPQTQGFVKEILFLDKKRYEQVVVRADKIARWNKKIEGKDIKITIDNSKLSENAKMTQDVSDRSNIVSKITAGEIGDASVVDVKLKKHSFAHFSSDATHIYITLVDAKKSSKAIIVNGKKIKRESKYTGKPISINVKNADVIDLIRIIADVSKLNIIADDSVKGKITIKVKNIPWDQLLDLIMAQKGLEEEKVGNVIRIAPLGTMERERQARIAAISSRERLSVVEKPVTGTIPLSYVQAATVVPIIKKIVYSGSSKGHGFIVADKSNNAIIYSDTKANVERIKKVVKMIDKKKPIIEIDARIVEVAKSNEKDFGIQWGGNFKNSLSNNTTNIAIGGANTGAGSLGGSVPKSDNFIVNLPGANPLGNVGLAIGNVSGTYNLSLKLSLGELNGYTKTISTPKIITLDNEKGTIKRGVEIPYHEVVATGGSSLSQVSFKDATLKLEVTPHLTAAGTILLKIKATKDTPDYSNIVGGEPPINTNSIQSNVVVKNGSTIVLGGLFTKTDTHSTSGIPGLSRIPFFGWLFKNESETHPRKELLIFITTHVVKD